MPSLQPLPPPPVGAPVTRVWLDDWQWACCGRPFRVGDDVELRIVSRTVTPEFADELGPALADTVDALESHHDDEPAEVLHGTVAAIHAVRQQVVEREVLRRPGFGAPSDAPMPPDGEDWPLRRIELGNGVSMGTRPTRFITQATPVPGATLLQEVDHVGLVGNGPDRTPRSAEDAQTTPPRASGRLLGWVVDVTSA